MTTVTIRRVRFQEESNNVFLLRCLENDRHEMLLGESGREERYKSNKRCIWSRVELAAQELKRKGYGILLRDTFSGRDIVSIQQNLNAFAQTQQGRGLELYISSQHNEERHVAKEAVIRAVLKVQETLKNQKCTPEEIREKLASVLHDYSETARTFAQRLGIADELAVAGKLDSTCDACSLMKQMHTCNAKKFVRRPSIQSSFVVDSIPNMGVACGSPQDAPVFSEATLMRQESANSGNSKALPKPLTHDQELASLLSSTKDLNWGSHHPTYEVARTA